MKRTLPILFTTGLLVCAGLGLSTEPLKDGAKSPEREYDGTKVLPRLEGDPEPAVRKPKRLVDNDKLSEIVLNKAAAVAAEKNDKTMKSVDSWVVPREWFVPLLAPASARFADPDFYIEDDGDLVIFPNLKSGYESSQFELSYGSWWSGLVEFPGIQQAQEVVISYALTRANEWSDSKQVTPAIRLRANAGDYQFATLSFIGSLGNAKAIPHRDEIRWYDISLFPGKELWTDSLYINLDIMAFYPDDSANIGWKIKDDIIVTAYY